MWAEIKKFFARFGKRSSARTTAGKSDGRTLGPWLRLSPLIALLALLVYALSADRANGATVWSVVGVGFITAAAAMVAGAIVGFLFGLPKTREQTDSKALLATNSNLDKVSDWLTTILIGLGLVQLGEVPDGVGHLAETIAPGLGGDVGAETFAAALLIFTVVDGFLIGYLWTRIVVSFRLRAAAEDLDHATLVSATVAAIPPPQAPPARPPAPPE